VPNPTHSQVPSNLILSALPPEQYHRLMAQSQEVSFDIQHLFYEAKTPVEHVYFMLEGLGSVVTPMREGESVEVLLVGREGMVGLAGLDSPSLLVPTRAFSQMSGRALKINSSVVREEFERGGGLQKSLMHYFQFALVQISQNVGCNRMHELETRLARWLLMVRDRIDSSTFMLTHEFLAQMLGTSRSTVTLAAGVLQRVGLIQYHRGEIQILNPDELKNASCECYVHLKDSWDQLISRYEQR
jgi:CRP-like cAMP-binding protein